MSPLTTIPDWAAVNFADCDFGDARRTRRAVLIAEKMARNPAGTSPRQMGRWADLKACYRFFNMPSVTFESLAAPHWCQTRATARGRVLILNDTTEISYGGDSRKVRGLGPVGKGNTFGFFLHNALMVGADTGEILGLAGQELFHRQETPEKENRRQKARRPRETEVWGRVIEAIGMPAEDVEYVHVCDRGADNLEVFCHLDQLCCHWVIRCSHLNRDVRPVVDGELQSAVSVEELLGKQPVLGDQPSLTLRSRPGHAARKARLEIRRVAVSIPQPRRRTPYLRKLDYRSLAQTLVEVREVDVPAGETPLRWVLWTSLPVETLEDARKVVEYYERRWLIEEFHKAIKTGCELESRQYQTSHGLEGVAGMVSVLAVRLLQLKQVALSAPETPATEMVPGEWLRVVETLQQRKLSTVRDFIRHLAALGGFLMRKGDGEPGWITLWRGTEILNTSLRLLDNLDSKCG
jgi:hypothetical protein